MKSLKRNSEDPEKMKEQRERDLDVMESRHNHRTWEFDYDGKQKAFIQRPLSFMAKIEFFALIGDTVEQAMEADANLSLEAAMGGFTGGALGTAGGSDDANSMTRLIAKLVRYSPAFLNECFLIWLHVPIDDRQWAMEAMRQAQDEGGLKDEEGFEILETFIDQNAEALENFFAERFGSLAKRAQKRFKRLQTTTSQESPKGSVPQSRRSISSRVNSESPQK